MKILVVNVGSSSCKLALFNLLYVNITKASDPIWEKKIEWSENQEKQVLLTEALKSLPIAFSKIDVIGHRLVHGKDLFLKPTLINPLVMEKLKSLINLAPIHLKESLNFIEWSGQLLPNTKQVAVFDTSFHQTLSEVASTYAGPYEWKEKGIKRYGFHGISYEYCSTKIEELSRQKNLKQVIAHLGNGSSIAAIDSCISIDTTMGFTPLEGLMMGTRSGSIDPGILFYLANEKSFEELEIILNQKSGLKGISGKTNDMRKILELCEKQDNRAQLSLSMFIHSVKKHILSMAATLGNWDTLVFTAGIGENVPIVRQKVCEGLSHFGIEIDKEKNEKNEINSLISKENSKVKVWIVKTEEDFCIACKIKGMQEDGII